MSDDQFSIETLRTRRDALLALLAAVGPFIQGSLCKVRITCGKPGCRCAVGERHEAHVLSKKVGGKTVTTHIPRDLLNEVESWTEQHRQIKKLMREISDLGEKIIRSHVKVQRQGNPPKHRTKKDGGNPKSHVKRPPAS